MSDSEAMSRVGQLLDCLAGTGQGAAMLDRLLQSTDAARDVAREIVASPAFELLYKEVRTGAITNSERKEADPAFVGIPDLDPALPFDDQFKRFFRPRLEARADGFATIFRNLPRAKNELLIIETGSLRIPGNWGGDGQSTFMFDALARSCGGLFFSIDVTLESLDTARRACSSATNLLLGDSVVTLRNLAASIGRPADLLYLDSFDLDPKNPMPSAIHHAMELIAAQPLVGPDTIVCVDDYSVQSEVGGKGLLLDLYFSRVRAEVLHSGYQKMWRAG
jgi:hypothetical protein